MERLYDVEMNWEYDIPEDLFRTNLKTYIRSLDLFAPLSGLHVDTFALPVYVFGKTKSEDIIILSGFSFKIEYQQPIHELDAIRGYLSLAKQLQSGGPKYGLDLKLNPNKMITNWGGFP